MVPINYTQLFNILSAGKIFSQNLEDSIFGVKEFKYTVTIHPSDYNK